MSLYVNIEKKLGAFNLKVAFSAENETLALLGPSGCGKSLTLKCIAGIEKPDHGQIILDGVTLFDSVKKINLSPQERRIGLMLQNYALFPNMTVLQNIAAGAKREKNKGFRREKIDYILDSFGLSEFSDRLPQTLSGGQQQRVALARILVSEPKILLLDEPFSALDSHLRLSLEEEVRQVIRGFGKTVLFVSHDREEVYRMSQQIAIMDQGSIIEIGEKGQIFEHPKCLQTARLVGCENVILAEDHYIGIRAKDIQPSDNGQPYYISHRVDGPDYITYRLVSETGDTALYWKTDKSQVFAIDDKISITIPKDKILHLTEGSERNSE